MLVASILTCIEGARHCRSRAGNARAAPPRREISPRSRARSISLRLIVRGGWKYGAPNASASCALSGDRSRSTNAIGALCSSCDMPVAAA